jgi:hypothetical protein
MTDANGRDAHESKIRDIMAMYDENAGLKDDNVRLQHALDIARQKAIHFEGELADLKVQRDYYLAQVVSFREKFGQLKESSILMARMVAQMIDDSTSGQAQIERQ